MSISVGVLSISILSACTVEDFKAGMYEVFYQRQCMEELGMRDCDPEHKRYDDYKKEREALMRPEDDGWEDEGH
ncbi:MAG TPA: hypothetical protein VJS66_06260 [Burkholderiales bacterium]|nr:hypothetical protein [Burkholderiales bacterium]